MREGVLGAQAEDEKEGVSLLVCREVSRCRLDYTVLQERGVGG